MPDPQLSTGLPALDRVLRGLIPGDNVVWQVDGVEDYLPFVQPYVEHAIDSGRRPVYFRFARHAPLIERSENVIIHQLQPEAGIEKFITDIHRVIDASDRGGWYVFDCLSELAFDWCSDRMLGNFFLLTCPYLLDVEAIAYFALLKNTHSPVIVSTIAETAQVLLEVFRHKQKLYVHPIKVQQRHSPTMYMLHACQDDALVPVTESATIAEILQTGPWAGFGPARNQLGVWNEAFLQAEKVMDPVAADQCSLDRARAVTRGLLRILVSRDERMLGLVEKYLCLDDVLGTWRRMIGTGLIGGKSLGMLLARAILVRSDPRWKELLEVHDSFYIGSDVFYTYLVQNGCWWLRQKQKDPESFLEGSEEARRRILTGTFPDQICKEFSDMLDYFGQCPIIVRSSSLLEDNFGNAFAGKYESVFCVNQGSPARRLENFMAAVRTIYASTMSEKALRYRAQRGILDQDEQMSLLVQRVSGAMYGNLHFPQVAGVGFSYNPYVWSEDIEPEAGLLRLVFGLGTRAVDRTDDDYTRVVALNAPEKRPEAGLDQVRRYAQRRVDALDIDANRLVSLDFSEVVRQANGLRYDLFASRDEEVERMAAQRGLAGAFPWVLTFEQLLRDTSFVGDMREMLRTLQEAYGWPVDIEFTANFCGPAAWRVNLVQCRPLQVSSAGAVSELPARIEPENIILEAQGAVIGPSRLVAVDRIIYVVPSIYGSLSMSDRYSVARLIGQIMHHKGQHPGNIMILGPGRWGTTTPSLGVPVSFAEIQDVSILCEIVAMREGLVPDVSLGTHFFSDLVESDILYLALFPGREGNCLNTACLESCPNRLAELLPQAAGRGDVVRVIDAAHLGGPGTIQLNANTLAQKVVCYRLNNA